MSELSEVFNEILFGSMGWLMLVVFVTILVSGGWTNRYLAAIFTLVSVFLGIEYLNHVSSNSSLIWGSFVMFLTAIFLMIRVAKKA